MNWDQMKSQVTRLFPVENEPKILMVGCGNSELTQQMYDFGYHDILNIDISDVVIDKMKEVFPKVEWQVADATDMNEIESDTFDLVIDKGTYDALACGPDKTIPTKLMKEMFRVCKPSGCIYEISNGTPEKRLAFFKKYLFGYEFEIEHHEQDLSRMARLINILRSDLKDKPLSHAFKQVDVLKGALMQIVEAEREKDLVINKDDDPKKKLMKMMLRIKKKNEEGKINDMLQVRRDKEDGIETKEPTESQKEEPKEEVKPEQKEEG